MSATPSRFDSGSLSAFTNIAVLLGALLLLSACQQQEPAQTEAVRPVRVMKVGALDDLAGRSFPGRARATQEVDLSFRVAGPLIEFPVSVGARVSTGGLIARIDPRDFEVQQRQVEGELQRAVANRTRANSEYQRLLGIQKQGTGLVSEVQVDRAKEDYQIAEANIATYEASLDGARDAVGYTHLLAPFDGTIVGTFAENFEYVQARQPIVRLLDNTRIEFEINVPETLISMVPQVQNLSVRFDAFPSLNLSAEILEIGGEASTTTRTYPVTLIMDQPEGSEILPGMAGTATGNASDRTGGASAGIVVPMTSVFSPAGGDQSFVWVIDPNAGTVTQRPVTLGGLSTGGVTVLAGLEFGEVIAIAGVHFLVEGQSVRPEME